jgi:hypothetical protein
MIKIYLSYLLFFKYYTRITFTHMYWNEKIAYNYVLHNQMVLQYH